MPPHAKSLYEVKIHRLDIGEDDFLIEVLAIEHVSLCEAPKNIQPGATPKADASSRPLFLGGESDRLDTGSRHSLSLKIIAARICIDGRHPLIFGADLNLRKGDIVPREIKFAVSCLVSSPVTAGQDAAAGLATPPRCH